MTGRLPRDRVGIKLTRGPSILRPGGGIRAAALPRAGPAASGASGRPALWLASRGVPFSSCELNQRYHLEQRNLNPSPTEQHPTRAAPAGPRGPRRGGPGVLPVRATLNDVRDPAYAFTRPSLHGRGSDAKAAQLQGALVHLDSLSPAAGGFAPGIPMSW